MVIQQKYCPVCGSAGPTQNAVSYGWTFSCDRCGSYGLALPMLAALTGALKEEPEFLAARPYLSAYLRQTAEAGETVEVRHDNWRAFAAAHAHTSVSRKLDLLFRLFATRSATLGRTVSLDPDDFVLLDAADGGEMQFLADALVEQGVIRSQGPPGSFVVTAKGWERLNPIDPGGVPGTCFVAMAFDPSLNEAYSDGIEPAIAAAGLRVVRVDKIEHNGVVTDLIQAEIRRAQVIVADVTMQRQGVYFEAGFALGLARIVIWTCRKDEIKKVHFDTRQYSHVVWETPIDLRSKLEARIRGTVAISVRH